MVTPLGKWVWHEELVAKAIELWPLDVIETALGDDAVRVLPAAIRTCELRARVPRYQVAMREHLAERESTTLSRVLTRELEDVAHADAGELSAAIPASRRRLRGPK